MLGLYARREFVRVQFSVKCFNVWVVIAVVFVVVVVVVVVGRIEIYNRKLTTQTEHVFLISVSC
jgi:hypothetical protein